MNDLGDREAFHAAIWKAPDDDLPRLVYADWLDDRGEHDAAAFLRLLCAVRTCPPDVDRLRPLVADFRRAMVKVPVAWIDDVCPVPPAVVVGAWVDVDRVANLMVLDYIRMRRRVRSGGVVREEFNSPRPGFEVRWEEEDVVHRLWEELASHLSPVAACAVEGVPAVVDVWSGAIMACATGGRGYVLRIPSDVSVGDPSRPRLDTVTNWHGGALRVSSHFGPNWVCGSGSAREERWLRQVAAEFDPAN